MFRTAYQRGMLTVLFSGGTNPLDIWEITKSSDGWISRFLDQDIKGMVMDIRGHNVSTTFIACPPGNKVLGITMPFLVMIVKNLKKYFVFEVTILDDTDTRRRFRIANFQSTTQIGPLCTVMPISLSEGWNQIQFNLAEFTRRAYKKQFVEVQKIRINANIRIRRIYFAERLLPEEELPPEYKLYFPLTSKKKDKENKQQQATVETQASERKGSKQASISKHVTPTIEVAAELPATAEAVVHEGKPDDTTVPASELSQMESKATTEAAPTEEAPTEEAPTEEAPTEEALTEEVPTEEAPTEEAPVAEELDTEETAAKATDTEVVATEAIEAEEVAAEPIDNEGIAVEAPAADETAVGDEAAPDEVQMPEENATTEPSEPYNEADVGEVSPTAE